MAKIWGLSEFPLYFHNLMAPETPKLMLTDTIFGISNVEKKCLGLFLWLTMKLVVIWFQEFV